jgi:hypothetical protein
VHRVWWYEWLGASRNGEWDSRQVDADPYDDGVEINLAAGYVVFTPTVASPLSGRYGPFAQIYVHGWFDWNNNGNWDDPGELVVNWSGYPGAGGWPALASSVRVTQALTIPPSVTVIGAYSVWARFRLDYAQNVSSPRGYARFGEVEDHVARVVRPIQPPWNGRVVTPSASLLITFTQVVTGVTVTIAPALLITPIWSTHPLVRLPHGVKVASAGGSGDELQIQHATFAPSQTYTITLSGGSVLNDPQQLLLTTSFSLTASGGPRKLIFLPIVVRSG